MLIYIVDDNDTNLMLFSQIAAALADDVSVECHADPIEALWRLSQADVDMVILDYMMPAMDGHEFLAEARKMAHMRDVPIIMVTAADERSIRHKALDLGATDFIAKPVDVQEVRSRMSNFLEMRRNALKLKDRNTWLAEEVRKATRAIQDREHELIVRLSRAAEFRDPETGAHIQRMAHFSALIAEELGQPHDFCDLLLRAAPMHDVGKLGTPDHILLKPGRLDPEEFEIMKRHASIGHSILSGSQSHLICLGAEIALSHHEKFDGSGYPKGLAGEDIPLVGRIVAVADVFDALTSARPYKKAWPVEEARDFLLEQQGRHFDPGCVQAFLRRWDEAMKIRQRYVDADEQLT